MKTSIPAAYPGKPGTSSGSFLAGLEMLLGASRATRALCAARPLALLLTGASLLGAAAAPTPPTALTLSFANSRKYTTCTKLKNKS